MKCQRYHHLQSSFMLSLLITMVILTAGCSGEGKAWEKARAENNVWAYRVYLKDYPQSSHSIEAYFRIAELTDNMQDYKIVLRQSKNKKNLFYDKAKKKVEELTFKKVEEQGTRSAFENFIKVYPKGPYSEQAREKLIELKFQEARQKDTIKVWEAFLVNNPEGPWADKARLRIKQIREDMRIPALKGVKTIQIVTLENYNRAKDLHLKVEPLFKDIIEAIGLKTIKAGKGEPDVRIGIDINGQPLTQRYSLFGVGFGSTRYAGARLWGWVSIVKNGKVVLRKSFRGSRKPPRTISASSYKEPKHAPYNPVLYLENSVLQKYFELMGQAFGYLFLKTPMHNSKRDIYLRAIDALINIKRDKALETFIEIAKSDQTTPCVAAMRGIGKLKNEQGLDTLFGFLKSSNRTLRLTAVEELAHFKSNKVIEQQILVLSKDRDASIRQNAASNLGKTKNPLVIDPLLQALKDSARGVRETAISHLKSFRDKRITERMITLAKEDPSNIVRKIALEIIGKSRDPRITRTLVAALKDKYYQIRENAAKLLRNRGWKPSNNEEKVFFLIGQKKWKQIEMMGKTAIPALIMALEREIPKSAYTLAKTKDKQAVKSLINALDTVPYYMKQEAIRALGETGDRSAVDPLIQLLKSSNFNIRRTTAEVLGKLGDKKATYPLIRLLTDRDNRVKTASHTALVKITGEKFPADYKQWNDWWVASKSKKK